ncbi:DNA replication and repair protein RecF [Anaerotignum neopropionicum]|uniref:DNA replication and repair protein RecF n=1 Tax=Anaerotignum neopropionicum TaxID=36847 RepID=A0A136WHV3_9FIRM|nr:DNA replication/repair protein RecF [Anaerotignum neopropionicum]KXL54148.1 DNA replication and repair protein RecF [Anaerotignum neopropionicum]
MQISEVSLRGFRNLEELNIHPSAGINVFYGKNAQGKTNFLESLYFCATGRSMRTKLDWQMIGFDKEESHIRILVQKNNRKERIDVHLKRDTKKGIARNGVPVKKLGDLFGTLYTVVFSPEDLALVKEGPGERRRFMDLELCQLSRIYYYDLQQYYRILKQRNNLLKEIQKKPSLQETLFVWDDQLIDFGERVMAARKGFLQRLDILAAQRLNALTGGLDHLKIIYRPNCELGQMAERIKRNLQRDIYLGTTNNGPHKDDILFSIDGKEVKIFGSQGQQRTTALAAKLAEIDLIREETGEEPVLLLDDVLSELDERRQKYLMESIDGLQSFLTCTGIEDVVKKYIRSENLFYVEKGRILPEN